MASIRISRRDRSMRFSSCDVEALCFFIAFPLAVIMIAGVISLLNGDKDDQNDA